MDTAHIKFVHGKMSVFNEACFSALREIGAVDLDYASSVFGLSLGEASEICRQPWESLVSNTGGATPLFVPIIKPPTGGYVDLMPYVLRRMNVYTPSVTYPNRWRHIDHTPRSLVRYFFVTYREMANADLDQAAASGRVSRKEMAELRDMPLQDLMLQVDLINAIFKPAIDDPANLRGERTTKLLRLLSRERR